MNTCEYILIECTIAPSVGWDHYAFSKVNMDILEDPPWKSIESHKFTAQLHGLTSSRNQ